MEADALDLARVGFDRFQSPAARVDNGLPWLENAARKQECQSADRIDLVVFGSQPSVDRFAQLLELKPGVAPPSADELTAFCRERLAGFKIPRRFLFRELPKTATGKIQKFALRSELAAEG